MNDERDGELVELAETVEQGSQDVTRSLIEATAGLLGAVIAPRDDGDDDDGDDGDDDEHVGFEFAEGTGVHRTDGTRIAPHAAPEAAADAAPADDASADMVADDVSASGEVPALSRKVNKPRVRTRRTRPRSKTIALKRLTRAELARGALESPPIEDAVRPMTRAECVDGPRPCPWVACKHHLYLDINPRTGSIKLNFPDLEPWELEHTCALDVADSGALTLEEIGLITNLTRERVRQVEVRGLLTLKARSGSLR